MYAGHDYVSAFALIKEQHRSAPISTNVQAKNCFAAKVVALAQSGTLMMFTVRATRYQLNFNKCQR